MKASYLGAMGYAHRRDFPPTWPTPPSYSDPETSVQSYQDGMEECEFAEEMGFEWVSFSEHHYSGRIATGTPAVMAAAVAERCKTIKIAMLGPPDAAEQPRPRRRGTHPAGQPHQWPPRHGIPARHPQRGPGVRRQSRRGTRPHAGGHGPHPEAMTEPQPFSWEGQYYQYRTVSVWPRARPATLPGRVGRQPQRRRRALRRRASPGPGRLLHTRG